MAEWLSPAGALDGGLRSYARPVGMVPGYQQRGIYHSKHHVRLPYPILHHPAAFAAAYRHPLL
ncbi:hypothetical protein SDC9_186326 [bioreactor metagenome]|uniref:Uncharacterized protein n=1 Tax=bioreactor metagenome TaxID=1076179 RepID=A0A645HIG5_9ZZZZ